MPGSPTPPWPPKRAAWRPDGGKTGSSPGTGSPCTCCNGIDLAVAYYACFSAGFVAGPINNRYKAAKIEYVLEHSGARLYVSETAAPEWRAGGASRASGAALLLYTSGTTARPKGVIHTQRTLRGNASYMEAAGSPLTIIRCCSRRWCTPRVRSCC